MTRNLLEEAREERRNRQEREELIRPLRQGFERLLETYGTPAHKLTMESKFVLFISSLPFGGGGAHDLASLRDLRCLEVTLGRGRDQVQVEVWDWLGAQIIVRVEGLPERLILKAEPEKSRIEEWRTVADMEEAEEDLFVMPPFVIPVPSAIPERLKIEERWIPMRFPNPEDVARYRVLLEDLERELGSH